MKQALIAAWYRKAWWLWLLWPLSLLYRVMATLHRVITVRKQPYTPPVPLIVIGNITVGGTGKTPLCLALARHFSAQGKRVVLVSRGYGGKSPLYPLTVDAGSDPLAAGDEAVLLAQQSGCKVVVDPKRVRAVQHAVQHLQPDLVLSDDGLQHAAIKGSLELLVVDGTRGLGNRLLLPAGPLREPARRLATVDAVISNGELAEALPYQCQYLTTMQLCPTGLRQLNTGENTDSSHWQQQWGKKVHAVAGIGNPGRFFASLEHLGFAIIPHVFDDHHGFAAGDLHFDDALPVIMTAKDAVKCQRFARGNWWALDVETSVSPQLLDYIESRMPWHAAQN